MKRKHKNNNKFNQFILILYIMLLHLSLSFIIGFNLIKKSINDYNIKM